MTVLFGVGGEIDAGEKFGAHGQSMPIDVEATQKNFQGDFPLKSTPYYFDGLWVGFLYPTQEKTQLDQYPSWVLNN